MTMKKVVNGAIFLCATIVQARFFTAIRWRLRFVLQTTFLRSKLILEAICLYIYQQTPQSTHEQTDLLYHKNRKFKTPTIGTAKIGCQRARGSERQIFEFLRTFATSNAFAIAQMPPRQPTMTNSLKLRVRKRGFGNLASQLTRRIQCQTKCTNRDRRLDRLRELHQTAIFYQ